MFPVLLGGTVTQKLEARERIRMRYLPSWFVLDVEVELL